MIKGVLLTAYFYGLLPLLIGAAAMTLCSVIVRATSLVSTLRSIPTWSPARVYVTGYVIYLAIFSFAAGRIEPVGEHYHEFAALWSVILAVLSIVSVILATPGVVMLGRKLADPGTTGSKAASRTTAKHGRNTSDRSSSAKTPLLTRSTVLLIIGCLILIVISIMLLIPHTKDYTPELAQLTIRHDTIFSVNPASLQPYVPGAAGDAASAGGASAGAGSSSAGTGSLADTLPPLLHLFYAYGATAAGINAAALIHIGMPFFLLAFFFCVYAHAGEILLAGLKGVSPSGSSKRNREEAQSYYNLRNYFVAVVAAIYFLFIFTNIHIGFAVYRNIWERTTLCASCLYPLFFVWCLDLILLTTQRKGHPVQIAGRLVSLIILTQAIGLCQRNALIPCGIIFISAIIIGVIAKIVSMTGQRSGRKGVSARA